MSEELLTIPQAAERMNRSYQWVFALVTRGKIPSQRAGKLYLLRAADVDNYEHQPRGKPPAQPKETKQATKRISNGKRP